MKKTILKVSFSCAVLLTMGILTDEGRADTLHKLEYPNSYGCICCPNVNEFGYFRTTWRQWPCEERPDINFPRSIGMEVLPTPRGEKQAPLPKAPETPPGSQYPEPPPGTGGGLPPSGVEGLPPPGAGGGLPPSGIEGLPPPGAGGGLPPSGTEGLPPSGLLPPGPLPEKESPKKTPEPAEEPVPETPEGEFKPIPGLPPGFETPSPLEPELPKKTKEDGNQPVSRRGNDAGRRGTSVEFRFVDVNRREALPPRSRGDDREELTMPPAAGRPRDVAQQQPKPRADWNAALQPGESSERVRPSRYASADDFRRAAPDQGATWTAVRAARGTEVVPQSYQARVDTDPLPPARRSTASSRPLALDGYSPVELAQSGRWAEGHPQYSVVYRGQIYQFPNDQQRRKFAAAPKKYIPAYDGRDPVLLVGERRSHPGEVDYCAMYRGRIYLFASGATQREFQRHPERYGMQD